jgi:hypothetical protein
MMRFVHTSWRFHLLLISSCVILQACALTEKPTAEMRIGMHYDAVLHFVMEYPLAWEKERRVAYGSKEGEVRWTNPDHPATLLRVKSSVQKNSAHDAETRIEQALQEYSGLEILSKEEITLPAGEAWHVTGQTAQGHLDIYLLMRGGHQYLISFTAAPEDLDDYQGVLERVTDSFQIMP